MNDFISFSFICGLLRSVAMGRPGLVAVLAGKRGWFLPCVLLPRKFVIILFVFFFLRGHQRPPGGDNAVGITLFCFLFFFLCGHWAPPSAKMPWGLNYWTIVLELSFFFLVWSKMPPQRRKCRGVKLSFWTIVWQLVKKLAYTMLISNNRASLYLWWKEILVKHQKVSKVLWKWL